MFLNRYQRIKTEQKVGSRLNGDLIENKKRLKIKNIRFSLDYETNVPVKKGEGLFETEQKELQRENQLSFNRKKNALNDKLPQIQVEIKDESKQHLPKKRNINLHHNKKKNTFLNSILQILRPNNQDGNHKTDERLRDLSREKKLQLMDSTPKSYSNQFIEQASEFSTTKHYRSPKIVENDFFKFKNSSVAKRKIFSQDKQRSKVDRDKLENKRQSHDLQKIEILTFSNKFPMFKK